MNLCRPQGYGSCCCQAGKLSDTDSLSRRALQSELLAALLLCQSSVAHSAATASDNYNIVQDTPLDLTVTDKVLQPAVTFLLPQINPVCSAGCQFCTMLQVFLKVGLCAEGLRQDRALGDASAFCTDATPLGEIKLGKQTCSGISMQDQIFACMGPMQVNLTHLPIR